VKYAFTPVSPEAPHHELPRTPLSQPKKSLPENYYREELIEQLSKPNAKYCWNLGIQFQTDTEMSIDDITVSWSEQQSPFFTLGRMTVEHQLIDYEKQFNFCEDLTFAPWNGLSVHRPVGALNRLRRFVYPLIASYRHKKDGDDYREPTNLEMND
jgi:catalase